MSVSRREFIDAVKIMLARVESGEYVTEDWEDYTETQVVGIASRPAGTMFVNVYALDRNYGGSEEGGWYYDSGTVELSISTTIEDADAIKELLSEVYQDHHNRSSVIYYRKPQDYSVTIEECPAEDWSDYRPWE